MSALDPASRAAAEAGQREGEMYRSSQSTAVHLGDEHDLKAGLGLGVVGEMHWDRIKHVTDAAGKEPSWRDQGYDSPGHQIRIEHLMDSGERTRGR